MGVRIASRKNAPDTDGRCLTGMLPASLGHSHVDKAAVDLGSEPRALVKGGTLHPVYRIYVPTDLVPLMDDGDELYA